MSLKNDEVNVLFVIKQFNFYIYCVFNMFALSVLIINLNFLTIFLEFLLLLVRKYIKKKKTFIFFLKIERKKDEFRFLSFIFLTL